MLAVCSLYFVICDPRMLVITRKRHHHRQIAESKLQITDYELQIRLLLVTHKPHVFGQLPALGVADEQDGHFPGAVPQVIADEDRLSVRAGGMVRGESARADLALAGKLGLAGVLGNAGGGNPPAATAAR